jgi:hypothetical protein
VLYRLFAPVSRTLSMLAAAFRLTQTAIIGLNLLNMFVALLILRDPAQPDSLALVLLVAQRYGYLLGRGVFGVSTGIVGVLVARSHDFPNVLAVLLGLAGLGYLTDSLMFFLIPGYDGAASAAVLAPALVAEVWLCLALLLPSARGRRRTVLVEAAAR